MGTWTASNYRQRATERQNRRLEAVPPQWIVNPATGEEFYLRRVDTLMSSILAGYLPASLTADAIDEWQKKGVKGMDADNVLEIASKLSPEEVEAGHREMKTVAEIAQRCCVIPFLSNTPPNKIEFTEEWRAAAIAGIKEKDPDFDESTFDPKELVLSPKALDAKDASFLMVWAQGAAGPVEIKGGQAMEMARLKRTPRKLARSSRTSTSKQKLSKAS